jgi:hypothetical protein
MKRFVTLAIIGALLLPACGGRIAHPVTTVTQSDDTLTCYDLGSQRRNNNGEIARLRAEKAKAVYHNFIKACLFFCIVPPFTMDFSNAQDVEVEALKARNLRLDELTRQKNCGQQAQPR